MRAELPAAFRVEVPSRGPTIGSLDVRQSAWAAASAVHFDPECKLWLDPNAMAYPAGSPLPNSGGLNLFPAGRLVEGYTLTLKQVGGRGCFEQRPPLPTYEGFIDVVRVDWP